MENLSLGCRARGLEPEVALLPDGARVARISLATGEAHTGALYDSIGRRHTNRGPYTSRRVSPETLAALADPTGLDDLAVRWIVDPEPMADLSKLLIDAAEALIHDEEQSRDGFAWFRSSNDEIERYRDGLVLDGQGLSPVLLGLAKLLPASSRHDGDRF